MLITAQILKVKKLFSQHIYFSLETVLKGNSHPMSRPGLHYTVLPSSLKLNSLINLKH